MLRRRFRWQTEGAAAGPPGAGGRAAGPPPPPPPPSSTQVPPCRPQLSEAVLLGPNQITQAEIEAFKAEVAADLAVRLTRETPPCAAASNRYRHIAPPMASWEAQALFTVKRKANGRKLRKFVRTK